MNPSPLLPKPDFVPKYNVASHPEHEEVVAKRVREYFCSHWSWESETQREIYTQQDAELWSLMMSPRASGYRAELVAEYVIFYTAVDDILETVTQDTAVKTVEGMKLVLLSAHPPQNELERIMHDIRSRMLSIGDARTRELALSVFTHTVTYLEHVVNSAERRTALEQGLDQYLKYRIMDAGIWFYVALYIWELDLDPLPNHLLRDPDFDMLLSLSADHLMLVNDMYSYRKEARYGVRTGVENGDVEDGQVYCIYNAVQILLREDGVNETNVMHRLGALICGKESDFDTTAAKLVLCYKDRASDLAVIQRWVVIMTEWMGANYSWSIMCRRYNKLDNLEVNNE